MSHFTCCGCWPTFIRSVQDTARPGRQYRRAKYNEREYSIEFENLIEEEDFYPPSQHIVTEVEKDLLSKGKYRELLQHESDIAHQQDAKLREREENVRLEDEAYIQAKREAARVAKQTMKKKASDKSTFPNMKKFDSVEFSKWLSEEKIDITSPELDVEDFESFLEKVRARSEEVGKKNEFETVFEQTLTQGLAATKIAGDALNALQPVELHAVGIPDFASFDENTLAECDSSVEADSVISSLALTTSTGVVSDVVSDNSVVVRTSQPPLTNSPIVHQPRAGGKFISNATASIISELSAIQPLSAQSSAVTNVSAAGVTSVFDISQDLDTCKMSDVTVDAAAALQTVTSQILGQHCTQIDALSSELFTQSLETRVQNSSDETIPISHHFSLDTSPTASLTNTTTEKLVDVSPLKDESQLTAVPLTTVVTINTPRNKAANLNPPENAVRLSTAIPSDVQSDKMTSSSVNQDSTLLEDTTFNSDDDFYDFDDDDFTNSNSNGAFEDYLA